MSNEKETRICQSKLTCRTVGKAKTVSGYAASFGTRSSILQNFVEIIAPGAFTETLKRGDEVIFNMGHDQDKIMARTRNRTLTLNQDSKGLYFNAVLPDTTLANDFYELVRTGIIDSCSFAFRADDCDWQDGDPNGDTDEDKMPLRTLRSVTLFDCCGCATAAYPTGTSINVSSVAMGANSVSPKVLAEARSRGGFATAPHIPAPATATRGDLLRRAEELGKQIAKSDYDARVAEFISNRPRPNSHIEDK